VQGTSQMKPAGAQHWGIWRPTRRPRLQCCTARQRRGPA